MTIKDSAARLNAAIGELDKALAPLKGMMAELKSGNGNLEALEADRQKLADELDAALHRAQTAEAKLAELEEQQKEFAALADETMNEIDLVINQVRGALGREVS